ncbi:MULTISPECIES: hypothetical protein [Aquimarina]|uniref:Histidine kinase n=1 Tax=Aquimarina algiphila TaxID=2047982 RepID=A0A554VF42_9FLAO|nr:MULTISPECIES: hypothetical protein [Aquimarina]TSE05766.1 hypothetical protein FOF46_21680 [Aquimarina algiphila]
MNKYKLTLIGLVFSVFIYVTSIVLELDLFEKFVTLLKSLEQYEFDKMIIPLIIFFVFIYLDMIRRNKETLVENTKVNIYKAMLKSSHHILNNFIYQMDIFKLTAEDTPGFDAQTLAYYEDIVSNTSHQINSLSNLTTIDEFSIRTSVMNNT